MSAFCIGFSRNRSGATSIEYALIAVLIAVVIVLSVTAVGDSLNAIFAGVRAGFETQ
jgi:pilus assembly protein Flp/PilA